MARLQDSRLSRIETAFFGGGKTIYAIRWVDEIATDLWNVNGKIYTAAQIRANWPEPPHKVKWMSYCWEPGDWSGDDEIISLEWPKDT